MGCGNRPVRGIPNAIGWRRHHGESGLRPGGADDPKTVAVNADLSGDVIDEVAVPGEYIFMAASPTQAASGRAPSTWDRSQAYPRVMSIPEHERWSLMTAVTGRDRASLTLLAPTSQQVEQIEVLVERRVAGEPLQYLEGSVQFGPLDLLVDGRALIPRPETERLWEEAVASLREAGPGTVIVDLGTGSGALALALKHSFPQAQVYGTDVSEAALTLAKQNAVRTGLEVTFLHGDLFEPLPKRFMGRVDLIVSNPPYVAEGEFAELPRDVRDHEPRVALVSGPSGTEILDRIADEGFWWVGIGGWLICEIGETQGEAVTEAFLAFDREVRQDLAGRDRILVARRGASCCV